MTRIDRMHNVKAKDGSIRSLTDEQYSRYVELSKKKKHHDRQQGVTKVLLNSAYGSFLNVAFRFGDPRMGQSTTLSGRVITTSIKEYVTKRVHESAFVAGDTDSCMFTLKSRFASDANLDDVVAEADAIAAEVNAALPQKMVESFFVPKSRNTISVSRELVGSRGLFLPVKKRYAIAVSDKEGLREKTMKIMGLDTKRTQLPEIVRDFLKECIVAVVRDREDENAVRARTAAFMERFRAAEAWRMGSLSSVSSVEEGSVLRKKFESGQIPNPRIHFAVMAADNTNRYIDFYEDRAMDYIRSGDKVAIFELGKDPSSNPLEYKSVALPVGLARVPEWFKRFPFKTASMESKTVYDKLDNMFKFLGWNPRPKETVADDVFE